MHAMYIMDMAILYAVASCAVRLQIIVNPPYNTGNEGWGYNVPTGGGKTVMACASLRHIYDGIEQIPAAPVKDKVVVWLVPSDAILEQTLTTLRDANHPYRRQINTDFGGRVEVLDRAQAQNTQNFTPATVRENLTIIVMSFDSLRTKRKEGRKANQENAALEPFVATYEHRETMIADVPENALTQVLNQKSPVVIISTLSSLWALWLSSMMTTGDF